MTINPLTFFNILKKREIDFFTGVPDSLLKEFCLCIDDNVSKNFHIITPNEGNAVALAAGYHLGTGKIPLVYMQNSGFGNAVNPLLSLCDSKVYSIPMILLVGWRGEPGVSDEPQHIKQGDVQIDLIKSLKIPFSIISKNENSIIATLTKGIEHAINKNEPYVFFVKKSTFSKYDLKKNINEKEIVSREQGLEEILKQLPKDAVIVSTTGKTSREIFEIRERNGELHNKDFLTVGSMGHCSSIALGIAISNPDRQVICIDGDGSLIMHMGILATIGEHSPPNLLHILINNFVHESVGGQSTSAKYVDIKSLVSSSNYKNVKSVHKISEIKNNLQLLLSKKGPSFLEFVVQPGSRNNLGRPSTKPIDNKKDFMKFLSKK